MQQNVAKKNKFGVAAKRANFAQKLSCNVNWNYMQDRYKSFQQGLNDLDNIDSKVSGTGDEFGKLEELLSRVKDQHDDFSFKKSAQRKVAEEKEAEKEKLGTPNCARTIKRNVSDSNTDGSV